MSIYEQQVSTQGQLMSNPFVASFTPDFPFALDQSSYGDYSSQSETWRKLSGTGAGQRRLPPTYENECFDSPPPAKPAGEPSTTAPAQAVSVQPTVFTLDENGRPVGLGSQTWDSFRKSSTLNEETTNSVSDSTTKGHGDIFDTYYPPTVSLSTGDRFSQLLEAKLGLDSALQTPKPTPSELNGQDQVHSVPSMGGREPLVAGSTPLVADTSSSSLNARHSYSSASGTPWSQATSQISTPCLTDGTVFNLKSHDSFNIERALHDPSQLQISPDLVAAMPDMARFPWQLPAQPQGQGQMVNGFIGQVPFVPSSQSPAIPSQEAFLPDQLRAQPPAFAYQAFNMSLPGSYAQGGATSANFGSDPGAMLSSSMSAMPIAAFPNAEYGAWSATPYQADSSTFVTTPHPLLPSTTGPVPSRSNTRDPRRASMLQRLPSTEVQRSSPLSTGQSRYERSPSVPGAKAVNKPLFFHNAVAGPSTARKRKTSHSIEDSGSRSESSSSTVHPPGMNDVGQEEGGEEKKPIVIACHNCRAKKLKCDGARPKCHHCCRRNQPVCEYDTFLRRRGPGKKTKRKRRHEPWESEYTHDADADDDAEFEHLAAPNGGEQEALCAYPQGRQFETFVPYVNNGETMTAANAYWNGRHSE